MLVIGRKIGEAFRIGDDVVVRVVRIGQGGVRIGIEAPKGTPIVRMELGPLDSGKANHAYNRKMEK